MSSNFLDQLYRRTFENWRVIPTSTSWSDMERLLNQHTNHKKPIKRFWLLTFTLLILSSTILLYEIYTRENKSLRPTEVKMPANKTNFSPKNNGLYAKSNPLNESNIIKQTSGQITNQVAQSILTNNMIIPMAQKMELDTGIVKILQAESQNLTTYDIDLAYSASLEPTTITLHPEFRSKKLDINIKEEMLLADIPEAIYEANNFQEAANLPSKVMRSLQEKASQLYMAASERNIIHQ